MTKRDFSLDNFKKWVKEQKHKEDSVQESDDVFIGLEVEPKISVRKLLSKIEIDEGYDEEVCNEFAEEGGIITSVEGTSFLIEVTSGSFYIHKSLIRKK